MTQSSRQLLQGDLTTTTLQAEGKLKNQVAAFEQEKILMTTVPVADNDILTLNVGGTLLATKRSTLTQV